MKKVRVIKEMPFAKVGEVVELEHNDFSFGQYIYSLHQIRNWIDDGWLEWVEEEKSLYDKLLEEYNKQFDNKVVSCERNDVLYKISEIAKEHYLDIFNKIFCDAYFITQESNYINSKSFIDLNNKVKEFRKAIEEA